MPIPENVAKVHLNFALNPDEIAVCTYSMQVQHGAGNTLDWDQAVNTLAQKAHDKWRTAMDSQRPKFGPHVVLTSVSTYHLDTTGHTLNKGYFAAGNSPWQGQGAGGSMPNEVAACVSLVAYPQGAFVPDRARRRGRMYLPPMDATVVASLGDANRQGRMSSGQQSQLTQALAGYFNDMHHTAVVGSTDPLGGEDYWSLGILSKVGNAFHRVEYIRLGDVFDAQRRRRNGQAETYVALPIADS